MTIRTVVNNPEESFSCLALIKVRSELAVRWALRKPAYCIYEYEKAFDAHHIRWGDGTWEALSEGDFNDVVLLDNFDESTWDEILGT